jgi:MFS family permease
MQTFSDTDKYVRKNLKRNTTLFTISGSIASLGEGLVPLGTMLTYFIANYTESNIFIGFMNFLAPLLTNVPQVFLARYMKKLKYNKWILMLNVLLTKSVWIIMGIVTLTVHNNLTNLIAFLLIYCIVNFGVGVQQLTWNDTVAKVVPSDVRGRFIGIRFFFAGIFEFLATLLLGLILSRFAFPNNYALVFLFSGVISITSSILFIWIKELPAVQPDSSISLVEYFKQLIGIIHHDKTFDAFLIYDHFAILARTISVFLIVYAKIKLSLTPFDMVLVTSVLIVTQTVFYLIWGYIDDHYGYRPSMAFSSFGFVLANLAALLFLKSIFVLIIIYIFIGASQSARNLGRINLVIHLAQGKDVRTYIALNNMLLIIPFAVFPLLCGIFIDHLGYQPFFIINIVSGCVAVLIMLFMVDEKRTSESISTSAN